MAKGILAITAPSRKCPVDCSVRFHQTGIRHEISELYRREAYRLWFEYCAWLTGSWRSDAEEALKHSASFYAPWGDVRNTKFDLWWKEKGHLFEDKYSVRRLARGELPTDPQALIVEIPLTQSPTVLIKRVAEIITEASATQQRASSKSKKT